jgi:hypothetical protein
MFNDFVFAPENYIFYLEGLHEILGLFTRVPEILRFSGLTIQSILCAQIQVKETNER